MTDRVPYAGDDTCALCGAALASSWDAYLGWCPQCVAVALRDYPSGTTCRRPGAGPAVTAAPDRRPRLIAAIPIDPPRKPTRTRKLKQHRQIQAWRRHAEKPAETGGRKKGNP